MFGTRLFPGGIHPREGINGKKENKNQAIVDLPAPHRVIIPLQQHIGAPAKPLVKKGDHVLMGQMIGEAQGAFSVPVHASISGTVVDIQPSLLGNGLEVPAVIIDNDHKDEWITLTPAAHPETMTAQELRDIVRNSGIVGMGGAGFPTAVKLDIPQGKTLDTLIINGAECEPYLTADHRLMLERSAEIVDGIRLVMLAMDVKQVFIGIEDNKQDAIDLLTRLTADQDGIEVKALPVMYPQGGEKQLIYALTKRKVPVQKLPIDVGVVVMNVGTVYAIQQAVRFGKPLIERVTTVGGLVNNPRNFQVRVGTTLDDLLRACGGMQPGVHQLIYGGPMMGTTISRTDVPVVKCCSGIVALGEEAMEPKESSCIRCGRCLQACPMQLSPTLIDSYVRHERFDDAEKIGTMNCIECGCCTFVCPAKRSLTQSCRIGKYVIRENKKRAREAALQAEKKEG